MIPSIFASTQRLVNAAPDLKRLHKATDQFETAFVKQLVSEMRKSSQGEFQDMPGNGVYDDMANQVLAEKLSSTGGFGVSKAMFNQLSKLVLAQSEQAQLVNKS
jgi:Rod binding domain-containing protein